MMKPIYFALLLVCVIGAGYMMMDSDDSEGAVTNPSNATLVDNIWYTIWDGEAIVRGPSSATLTSITIPSTVTIDGNSYTVTGIAGVVNSANEGAFMDMLQLTTVTLPYTLESFNAEYNANMQGATYSNAFAIYPSATPRVSQLTTVNWDIPSGETCHLTSIGGQAFWNCNALTTFTVPDSVTYIGNNAFSGCSAWELTAWPASLNTLGYSAFGGTLTALSSLPASITAVPNGLFSSCANMTQFTLHSGVTSIGNSAFAGTGLTSFTIPDNVLTVGESAFASCTSLQTLTFPSGLTEIPRRACDGCTSLSTVNMPAGVTSISNYAFENCSSLHIALPSTLTSVGEYAFKGCTSMNITSIPSGLTSIPNYAFQGAMGGSRLEIPATVTSIGDYAFGIPTVNGQAVSSMEIIFEGVKGASTTTVTVGTRMFDDTGLLNPPSYSANTTFTITLYGMTYKYGTSSTIRNTCFTGSGNVSFVYNVYSKDTIDYLGNGNVANYYATYNGVDYIRTLRSGSNWNAYAIGLADDTVTSITIQSGFYYYGTSGPYCTVQGIKGSQTADGYGAFGGSTSLTSATLNYLSNTTYNPNGNNYSYANTFKDCVNLTTVSLPSITSLPYGIFSGCTSLDITWIPSNLKTFGAYAFEGCTSLTLSNINLIVNRADDCAFSGCTLLNPASFALGNSPIIGDYAFEGCENLTIGSLKNATLGEGAFSGCTALNVTSIDNTSVGDFALENCTALSAIVITDSSFGDGVFSLSLASEPTETERSLSLLFMSDVGYTPYTFMSEAASLSEQPYDRIYDIVDLGGNNFTSQSSGLPADAQVSDTLTVNALSMLQKIEQEEQHEVVADSSTTSVIMAIIPVFVVLAILMYAVSTIRMKYGSDN